MANSDKLQQQQLDCPMYSTALQSRSTYLHTDHSQNRLIT